MHPSKNTPFSARFIATALNHLDHLNHIHWIMLISALNHLKIEPLLLADPVSLDHPNRNCVNYWFSDMIMHWITSHAKRGPAKLAKCSLRPEIFADPTRAYLPIEVSRGDKMKALKFTTKGASLIEYGILAGLVSVVAIAAVVATGTEVRSTFSHIASEVAAVKPNAESVAPALDRQMNFTITAGEVPSANTWYGYREGSFGSISGDNEMHMGRVTMLEWASDQPSARTYLNFSGGSAADFTGAILDCGSDGSLVLDNADYQTGALFGFDGDPLSILEGDIINCTMSF